MAKCLICKDKEADKTGSHIVPHFLTKRIDNEPGATGRDKELGFTFSDDDTRMYFGRAVLPETLEEVYGEVDDKLLAENKIDGVVDYIFCSDCEKKLSVIEGEYAKTIKISGDPEKTYFSEKRPFLAFLFWISVFYRLSIMEDSGFKLKEKDEKRLARILKMHLKDTIQEYKRPYNDPDLLDMGYKILRAPDFSNRFPTFLYAYPFNERPYVVMVDEYIVFFYFKKSCLKGMKSDFFGSMDLQDATPFIGAFDSEEILSVTDDRFKDIIQNKLNFFAQKKYSKLEKRLNMMHRRMFPKNGQEMNPNLKMKILERIGSDDKKLGQRNKENDIRIIKEEIIKFYKVAT